MQCTVRSPATVGHYCKCIRCLTLSSSTSSRTVPLAALLRKPHLRRERLHLLSQSSAAQHLLPPSGTSPRLCHSLFPSRLLSRQADLLCRRLEVSTSELPSVSGRFCVRRTRMFQTATVDALNSPAAVLFCPRLAGNRRTQVHIVLDTTLINASVIAWQLCPQTPRWGIQDTTMARVSLDFS